MTLPAPAEPLAALVVDDTALYRRLLSRLLEQIPALTVVGTAQDGVVALRELERRPIDLVVLDIEMPNLDGIGTLAAIRARWPRIGVVIVSGIDDRAAELTVEALSRGALDFVPKGAGGSASENEVALGRSLREVIAGFRARRQRASGRFPPGPPPAPSAPERSRAPARPPPIAAVAIAASTGGPPVLGTILSALPGDLPVPVFVVQHMPRVFTGALARSLNAQAALSVLEARDGLPVQAGTAFVAPGGSHMVVRRLPEGLCIGIVPAPAADLIRPSADVLLRSLATTYPGRTLAVVLTGMGDDGAAGVRALKRSGAYCLTQSEDTCVVFGMPRAVVEAGLSDEQLSPAEVGSRIRALVAAATAIRERP